MTCHLAFTNDRVREVNKRVSVGQDGDLVETLRCYGCQCTWRQLPEQQEDAEAVASYSCPQCGGDFVERMSIGIAATRPRVPINEEVFRQVQATRTPKWTLRVRFQRSVSGKMFAY